MKLTSSRHVLCAKHNLHGDERDLHPRPGAKAREDLVADPFAGAGVDLERFEQAGTDGEDRRAEPHKGRVPAEDGDEAADDDGGDGDADEVGDGANARSFGCGAFDGLEVEGEVEDVSGKLVSGMVLVRWSETGKVTDVYKAMARKQENQELAKTVRCFNKILGGIVALSPSLNCRTRKTVMIRPKPMIQPYTLESLQAYTLPPHCSASKRQTMAHMRKKAPKISICAIFSRVVMVFCFLSGFLKKKKTVNNATPPNGRLIQKHHLQDARSVNAPPRIGPTTDDIPNILDNAAM